MNKPPRTPDAHADTPRLPQKPALLPLHFKYEIRQHGGRLTIAPALGIWGNAIFVWVFFAALILFGELASLRGWHAIKATLMWGLPASGLAFLFVERQSVTAEFALDRDLFQAYRYRKPIQKPLSSLAAIIVQKNRKSPWHSWGIRLRFRDGASGFLLETGEQAARTIATAIAEYANLPLEEEPAA